jgi:hypothetical protein
MTTSNSIRGFVTMKVKKSLALIRGLKPLRGFHLATLLEQELDLQGATIGLISSLDPTLPPDVERIVTLVTRHEPKASNIIEANKACACTGNRRHLGTSPPKSSGQECDFCDGIYECY